MGIVVKIVVTQWSGGEYLVGKGHGGDVCGDGNVLYFDLGPARVCVHVHWVAYVRFIPFTVVILYFNLNNFDYNTPFSDNAQVKNQIPRSPNPSPTPSPLTHCTPATPTTLLTLKHITLFSTWGVYLGSSPNLSWPLWALPTSALTLYPFILLHFLQDTYYCLTSCIPCVFALWRLPCRNVSPASLSCSLFST